MLHIKYQIFLLARKINLYARYLFFSRHIPRKFKHYYFVVSKYIYHQYFIEFQESKYENLTLFLPPKLQNDMNWMVRQFDSSLGKSLQDLNRFKSIDPPGHNTAHAFEYNKIINEIQGEQFDCLVCVPWFQVGGLERALLKIIKSLNKMGLKCLVFTTYQNFVHQQYNDDIQHYKIVDVSRLTNLHNANNIKERALASLIIQLGIKHLFLSNSLAVFETVKLYGRQIAHNGCKIYPVIPCNDNTEGFPTGFCDFIPDLAPFTSQFVADNNYFAHYWHNRFGVGVDKFSVMPYYVNIQFDHQFTRKTPNKHILWISRFDIQKRPDRVAYIAKQLPEYQFTMFGTGNCPPLAVKNIHNGGLADVRTLDFNQYSAFLYTADWDGVPYILLEMMTVGLPIISCHVEGIQDILTDNNSAIVYNQHNIDEYCRAIERVHADYDAALQRAQRAKEYVESTRTEQKFDETINQLILK